MFVFLMHLLSVYLPIFYEVVFNITVNLKWLHFYCTDIICPLFVAIMEKVFTTSWEPLFYGSQSKLQLPLE